MRVLVVDDCFAGRGPGVVVTPKITDPDGRWAKVTQLRLVPPGGAPDRVVKVTLDVAHVRGVLAPWAMFRLHGVSVEDVPVGSELWWDA